MAQSTPGSMPEVGERCTWKPKKRPRVPRPSRPCCPREAWCATAVSAVLPWEDMNRLEARRQTHGRDGRGTRHSGNEEARGFRPAGFALLVQTIVAIHGRKATGTLVVEVTGGGGVW